MVDIVASPSKVHGAPTAAWTAGAVFTIAFLGTTAGVQMSDRGLQAILLSAIQRSFSVSDATIGALQGLAGVLVGSAVAVPVARLADIFSRKPVLLGLIVAWSALVVLSALSPNFPIFFIGRAASGVTEFAMIPIVYSMIPDLVPEQHRVGANLVFAALMAAGASAGFYYGEAIVEAARVLIPFAIDTWRKAYLLLAMAGLPLFALGLVVSNPAHHKDQAEGEGGSALAPFLRERWRAVGLFVGIAGCLMIAVQALNPLIAMALERRFTADLRTIGHALGLITLVTTIGCLPVAGVLDKVLRNRFGVAARPLVMGAGAIGAIPCLLLLLASAEVGKALLGVALFLFLTSTANALVPTMLQDLTPPAIRARSFAVWSFVVSVFCAVGPTIAGVLSDMLLGGRLLTAIVITAIPALILSAGSAASLAMGRRSNSIAAL